MDQGLLCGDGFSAKGKVSLGGAHIGGQLDLSGAILINPRGWALTADGLTVDQDVLCGKSSAQGEIRLAGAHIRGVLDLRGASITSIGGRAITAEWLIVDRAMLCERLSARGAIRLGGAHIGGVLDLSGATLVNPGGPALLANKVTVDQSVLCGDGFSAQGEVSLGGARIGGQLDLSGASLANPGGLALFGDRLGVAQEVFCRDGFTAQGEVRLAGAQIGGVLDLQEASLANPGGVALRLARAKVATLFFLPAQRPDGAVDLTNAAVGAFLDDSATWPTTLRLGGFAYDTLEDDQVSVPDRLRWLARHSDGYTPQLYDQLAGVYRRAGLEEAARKAGIAKQWHRRAALNPAGKLLNWLLYATVGYGYRTWLAGAWLTGLAVLGTWIFSRAYPAHMVAATAHPAAFHPLAYTLDVLLPIVDLGQQSAWQPQGAALYWSWALIGAGWVLTTAVVAGLTGILKRN